MSLGKVGEKGRKRGGGGHRARSYLYSKTADTSTRHNPLSETGRDTRCSEYDAIENPARCAIALIQGTSVTMIMSSLLSQSERTQIHYRADPVKSMQVGAACRSRTLDVATASPSNRRVRLITDRDVGLLYCLLA